MTDRGAELAEAMRAARRGDSAAYRRALGEIARLIRPFIRRRLGVDGAAAEDGEDVVQETLLAIHLKNETWDEARPILPWIFSVADHKAIDALRRRQRAGRLVAKDLSVDDLAEIIASPENEREGTGFDVERQVAALPSREREVVQALTLEGSTVAAVAERLGIRPGTVRVAFHRGLKRLAEAARNREAS